MAGVALCAGCVRFKPVEHRAEGARDYVEARLEAAPERVSEAVTRVFRQRGGAIDFSRFHLFRQGEQSFPEVERLRTLVFPDSLAA